MKTKVGKSTKKPGTITMNVMSADGRPFRLDCRRKKVPGGIELKCKVIWLDQPNAAE